MRAFVFGLRASVRIGELVQELEKAQTIHTADHQAEIRRPSGGTSKREAIKDAGLSKSSAHRYEQLTGGREERAQRAGKAAAEHYFAKARADGREV